VFRDVAVLSGLRWNHFTGATGQYYFPENTGPGVALLDYDRDGDLDIYVLQGIKLDPNADAKALFPKPQEQHDGHRLFRNDLVPSGTLSFVDITDDAGVGYKAYGMGVAVGDYDNDGDPDIYVTHFGSNVLYRNEGDGTFKDVTAEAGVDDSRWSTSASFFDYDSDGDLDLFVANYVNFSLTTHRSCTIPASGHRDYCGPSSYRPVPDRLFRNDGDSFSDVTLAAGLSLAYGPGLRTISADFNRDGRADLYVANDGQANQLWINEGQGNFRDDSLMAGAAFNMNGAAEASMGVTAGDVDGDGDEDLFMTHLDGETNTLYLNRGDGSFHDVTNTFGLAAASVSYTGFGSRWFDFDNDGYLDLFIANGAVRIDRRREGDPYPYGQPNQLFRNSATGHFIDLSVVAGPGLGRTRVSRGAAFGDVDNDGDVDIVVTNNNGPLELLLNEIGTRNNWLSVSLQGTESNRDAAGARLAVLRRGQPPLWRRAHTDGSYLSASDPRIHVGLGAESRIEAVGVEWPNGRRELWKGIQANTQIVLVEGSGDPWTWDAGAAKSR
jgi:hypothetical protein